MIKMFGPAFLVLIITSAQAQVQPVDAMLKAEKAFAAYAVAHDTKTAFLKYLDSSATIVQNGKLVNGFVYWSSQKHTDGLLNWWPLRAGIASSGELGFTTGQWTFQNKNIKGSVTAQGRFASIWKQNVAGEWKVLMDIGVYQTSTPAEEKTTEIFNEGTRFIPGTWNNLLLREERFIKATDGTDTAEKMKAYKVACSAKGSLLNRNDGAAYSANISTSGIISNMPLQLHYAVAGSGISKAGDIGFVYGTTFINNKPGGYLRVWQRQGKEWKLALEVLPF